MRRRGHEREEGAAASALLIVSAVVALAALMYIALPFGAASDAKSESRTAADAAALAGAEHARDNLLDVIELNGWSGGPWGQEIPLGPSAGYLSAADFASRNDGTLTYYDFEGSTGRAYATVSGREVADHVATAEATASIVWPSCDEPEEPEEPDPPEEPGPPDDGDDEEPPDPPEFDEDQVWCNGFWLPFVPELVDGEIRYVLTPGALGLLREAMEVRLVD